MNRASRGIGGCRSLGAAKLAAVVLPRISAAPRAVRVIFLVVIASTFPLVSLKEKVVRHGTSYHLNIRNVGDDFVMLQQG
ncbi:hypothetical protein D3C87_1935320 [compost metagenome]